MSYTIQAQKMLAKATKRFSSAHDFNSAYKLKLIYTVDIKTTFTLAVAFFSSCVYRHSLRLW